MSDASPVLLTPDVVGGLAGKRVLVVGDIMLDAYLIGDADRISPEAPVPVVRIEKERYLLGGCGQCGPQYRGAWRRSDARGRDGQGCLRRSYPGARP